MNYRHPSNVAQKIFDDFLQRYFTTLILCCWWFNCPQGYNAKDSQERRVERRRQKIIRRNFLSKRDDQQSRRFFDDKNLKKNFLRANKVILKREIMTILKAPFVHTQRHKEEIKIKMTMIKRKNLLCANSFELRLKFISKISIMNNLKLLKKKW